MKRRVIVFLAVVSIFLLLSPHTPQAAGPAPSAPKKATSAASSERQPAMTVAGSTAVQPHPGGIWKVIFRSRSDAFGYPARIAGAGRDYAPPFFDRLLSIGEEGKYKPGLALSWDTSKDGKTITFKLRRGVAFHDGTPFNAQAVKANIDRLIPPNPAVIEGISSVDVVDDYTIKLNLPSYNNLIFYHFATNPATYIYSPDAVKKNGEDWAMTHPVGTGPFLLKDYQPNVSLTVVRNPNYWQQGLPLLDGIEMAMISDPMTQAITFKSGQANAIYDAQAVAADLRDAGYPLQMAPGSFLALSFDTKNSEAFSKVKVREAIEYAIDKEAICNGPGQGLYTPVYQVVPGNSPDYNKACLPRKYDAGKAKKLLTEAGYPNGFGFKMFIMDSTWKDGWVAVQNYLDKLGIKMEINYLNVASYNLIRMGGKIEKGAAAYTSFNCPANSLFMLEYSLRSNATVYPYIVKPVGIDALIDRAKLAKNPQDITKINQQIVKLLYDDETIVPFYRSPRIAVLDKSVQNTGWFINGDEFNNQFGARTWLKK